MVTLDHNVRFQGQVIDIPRPLPRSLARARVVLHQHFDGSLHVFHESHCVATAQSPAHAGPLRLGSLATSELPVPVPRPRRLQRPPRSTPWKPAPSHPWKAPWKQLG